MKHTILNFTATAALAFASIGGQTLLGQEVVQTTASTTTAGTISDFSPDTIVVRTEDATTPVRYSYTKSTTYVDENGSPVSMETVRSGLPVTIYYERDGDNLVASKVVVRKTVSVSAPAPVTNIEKTTTTTTTTTNK